MLCNTIHSEPNALSHKEGENVKGSDVASPVNTHQEYTKVFTLMPASSQRSCRGVGWQRRVRAGLLLNFHFNIVHIFHEHILLFNIYIFKLF